MESQLHFRPRFERVSARPQRRDAVLTPPERHDRESRENAEGVRGQVGELDFAPRHEVLKPLQQRRVHEYSDRYPVQPAPQHAAEHNKDAVSYSMENEIEALVTPRQLQTGVKRADGNRSSGRDESRQKEKSQAPGYQHCRVFTCVP